MPAPLPVNAGKGNLVRPSDVYLRGDDELNCRKLSLHFGGGKVDGETADDKTYEGLVSTRLACLCDVFAQLVGQRVQRL